MRLRQVRQRKEGGQQGDGQVVGAARVLAQQPRQRRQQRGVPQQRGQRARVAAQLRHRRRRGRLGARVLLVQRLLRAAGGGHRHMACWQRRVPLSGSLACCGPDPDLRPGSLHRSCCCRVNPCTRPPTHQVLVQAVQAGGGRCGSQHLRGAGRRLRQVALLHGVQLPAVTLAHRLLRLQGRGRLVLLLRALLLLPLRLLLLHLRWLLRVALAALSHLRLSLGGLRQQLGHLRRAAGVQQLAGLHQLQRCLLQVAIGRQLQLDAA